MSCEKQKEHLETAQALLDDFKAQCHDGIRGACGKITDATRKVAAAKAAYDHCLSTVRTPPPSPTNPADPSTDPA